MGNRDHTRATRAAPTYSNVDPPAPDIPPLPFSPYGVQFDIRLSLAHASQKYDLDVY